MSNGFSVTVTEIKRFDARKGETETEDVQAHGQGQCIVWPAYRMCLLTPELLPRLIAR